LVLGDYLLVSQADGLGVCAGRSPNDGDRPLAVAEQVARCTRNPVAQLEPPGERAGGREQVGHHGLGRVNLVGLAGVFVEDALEAVAVELKDKNNLIKCFSYLKAIPSILHQVKKADYLYVFLPGNLSILVSICAIVLKKSYGVYLRGELGIDTKLMGLILSNGDFVHANGHVLVDKAHRFCSDVELTIPMLDLTYQDCFTRKNFKRQPPWNLLYVGRVEVKKGINELVEAAQILKDRKVEFKLNIVGKGSELEKIKTKSREKLGECVQYLGLISDRERLFSLYMNSDLFVFPSHEEGFPRVLYEAMAFQTPIITTFVGSISSVMEHRVNCLRIDVGNPPRLALVIEGTLGDVDLRRKIACNGNKTIRQMLKKNDGKSHAMQVQKKVTKYAKTK